MAEGKPHEGTLESEREETVVGACPRYDWLVGGAVRGD